MIKNIGDYSIIKKSVAKLKGGRVLVTQNLGRNKFVSYSGIVTGVYSALFTVIPDKPRFDGKTSFSYSEIMCGNVRLKKIASR